DVILNPVQIGANQFRRVLDVLLIQESEKFLHHCVIHREILGDRGMRAHEVAREITDADGLRCNEERIGWEKHTAPVKKLLKRIQLRSRVRYVGSDSAAAVDFA